MYADLQSSQCTVETSVNLAAGRFATKNGSICPDGCASSELAELLPITSEIAVHIDAGQTVVQTHGQSWEYATICRNRECNAA